MLSYFLYNFFLIIIFQIVAKLKISTDAQLSTMRGEVEHKAAIIADQKLTENSLRAEIKEHLEKIQVLKESYSSLQSIVDEMSAVLQVTSSLFYFLFFWIYLNFSLIRLS